MIDLYARQAAEFIERIRVEESLKEADRRKNEFLAVLAHELRNPLAPVRNGLQVLRLRVTADELSQRTVNMMDRQMTHLVHLVDDLLDVSRITRGRLALQLRKLSLADVLAIAVEASRSLIEAHGHCEDTEATVSVRDTGIGIPPEALEDIFEMFSQVRPDDARADGGLGIGLSLVRTLVRLHGGSVSASSEGAGRGSTFTVRLPLSESNGAPTDFAVSSTPSAAKNTRYRVLVVDDNRDAAESLAMLLQINGYEVHTATDGAEAIARTEELRPSVIFMDVGMPRMNGLEATRSIRALPFSQHISIVALTGWGQEGDRHRTRSAGMDHHLVKPVSSEALQDVLSTIDLNERSARSVKAGP